MYKRKFHASDDDNESLLPVQHQTCFRQQQKQYASSYLYHNICNVVILSVILFQFSFVVNSFTIVINQQHRAGNKNILSESNWMASMVPTKPSSSTILWMSSNERSTTRTTKKSVQTIDKVETKAEEQKKKEEMWRVVLHNDEVHTFNYVVRSLTKVIGTLDRKAAFEICVQTHGIGKATITKTWKKQAEQFCLGLQRQGLTVSISPDEDFEGGHSGGGL